MLIIEVLKSIGFEPHINERAYRNRPLSEEQKTANRERSKTRAQVEHVFGDFVTSMGGKVMRSFGLARAQTQLDLKNLVYNLKRFVCLETQPAAAAEMAGSSGLTLSNCLGYGFPTLFLRQNGGLLG